MLRPQETCLSTHGVVKAEWRSIGYHGSWMLFFKSEHKAFDWFAICVLVAAKAQTAGERSRNGL